MPSKNPARIMVFWDKYQIRDCVGVLAEPLNIRSPTLKPEAESDKTVTYTVTKPDFMSVPK